MATQINVILLKNFSLLGKVGDVAKVQSDYAENYLFPNGIAEKIESDAAEKLKNHRKKEKVKEELKKISESSKDNLYVYSNPENAYVSKNNLMGRIPPFIFRIKLGDDRTEKISWKWYPTNRLNNLPAGDRYVVINHRRKSYFGTFNYLQKLRIRNCHSPLIVDGSNLGWTAGKPAIDPIFYLYDYISDKSEKFFFPLIWAFDKSFRRKLSKTEKRELNEFCSWSGVAMVDYADKEIFKLAKIYKTRFIFSQDHFKEYHTEYFTRITFR